MAPVAVRSLIVAVLLTLVACDVKTAATPTVTGAHAKASLKPKATASIVPVTQGGESAAGLSSPTPAVASPSPDTLAVSASPSPSPVVAVSAPPIVFPYVKAGVAWNYALAVKLSLATANGTVAVGVKSVNADGAELGTRFTLTDVKSSFPVTLPGQGKANNFSATVKKDVPNPYALGVLFPKAGSTVVDTVTAVTTESLTVGAGTFDTTRYTINEVADGTKSVITLWTQKDGSMVQEQIAGDKPPPLVDLSSLGAVAGALGGKTTTTLSLSGVGTLDAAASAAASIDPHASAAASTMPAASGASDPASTGTASVPPSAAPSPHS